MKLDAKFFRSLPILAAVRDRSGRVIDATEKLLTESGLTRKEAIGRRAVDLWPHMAESIAADGDALEDGKTVEQLQFSPRSSRWYRSTHTPEGDCILWCAEDITSQVELDSLRKVLLALAGPPIKGAIRPIDVRAAEMLMSGLSGRAVAMALNWNIEEFTGSMVRILRS